MPQENPIVRAKKITDITDQLKLQDRQRDLLRVVQESITLFQDAYRPRRQELFEINALYRNKSYLNKRRAEWQTKSFIPVTYDAVERKTSILMESLWGNRIASPFTAIGKTPEDHAHAFSAETLLNNTVDTIGFYESSEEGLRSTVKYGLGVYRYGWEHTKDEYLWREPVRNDKGDIQRKNDGSPILRYTKKKVTLSRPFIRAVDIMDHIGWDPTAKKFEKRQCDFVYELREENPETIWEKEQSGEYEEGSFSKITESDPHGIESWALEDKGPQLRRDDGIEQVAINKKARYAIADWYGWFDIDGDGKREFIKVSILENRLILSAQVNLMNEYPFVDIQYSRSLHSLTPWGVIDPVVALQYHINELYNQRGDSIKLKLNPQFAVNIDKILEDHAYVSQPGAMHPFALGDGSVKDVMEPLQFQSLEFISTNEEDRVLSQFARATGVADLNQVLTSSNKDTPASTVISILNEQQAGNSMIVNGILNRHGTLGSRILRLIQTFGDEKFVVRYAGRRGLEFREESIENILGDYDVKITTSSFFGNRQIELQHLIQLKPMWQNAPHIDQIELDKAILENILPKRMDKILRIPEEPLSPLDEQLLFLAGQGESVTLSEQESLPDLQNKLRIHQSFEDSEAFKSMDELSKEEWEKHVNRIVDRIQELETQRALQQQQAARGMGGQEGVPGPGGNLQNTGLPEVRMQAAQNRPAPNNLPQV